MILNAIITEKFKKYIKSKYNKVHFLNFDNFSKEDLLNLKKIIGPERSCIFMPTKEPHYFEHGSTISKQWIEFKDALLENQIYNCDFFITSFYTNQHKTSLEYLNTNSYGWSFYNLDIDYFSTFNITNNAINDFNKDDKHNLFLEECTMKFSYINFTHRMHRQLFSKFLIKEKLIANNLISINPANDHTQLDQFENVKIKDTPKVVSSLQNGNWFYNKNLLDLWKDTKLEYYRHPAIDMKVPKLNPPYLNKAAIHIVTESAFNFPFNHFTEKTTAALLCKRPFIIIAPAGNLKYLRTIGFKTFDSIIDESYDNIPDPNLRLEKIMDLILDLNKNNQEQLVKMIEKSKDILIHNYMLMLDKIKNFENPEKDCII